MQTSYRVWRKHPNRNLLRDDGLAVASECAVKRCVKAIVIIWTGSRESAICVRGRGGHDRQRQHGHVILLREANLGGGCVQGGLEGSIERRERDFEIDDIVGSRLYGNRFEDGILGGGSDCRNKY